MQEAQKIERGETTIDAGNVLFSDEEMHQMERAIAIQELSKDNNDFDDGMIAEKIAELREIHGFWWKRYVHARLIDKGADKLITYPNNLATLKQDAHNHETQVDEAAKIFGSIAGKVSEQEKQYEKTREFSIDVMRDNKVYQFCMLLAGFTNEKMDKYWVTPSENTIQPRQIPVGNNIAPRVNADINDVTTDSDGNITHYHIQFPNGQVMVASKKVSEDAGVYPIRAFGSGSIIPVRVDMNILLGNRTRDAVDTDVPRATTLDGSRTEGTDQGLNSLPEIGGQFHKWYVQTSWADGKLHLSPMVYAHIEETHTMIQLKWPHLKNVEMWRFVESLNMRAYFARLVAFNMRTSDIFSGKRYHSQATYPRVNNEKARLLNVFRHVVLKDGDLMYTKDPDMMGFVQGTQPHLNRYLDDVAIRNERASADIRTPIGYKSSTKQLLSQYGF